MKKTVYIMAIACAGLSTTARTEEHFLIGSQSFHVELQAADGVWRESAVFSGSEVFALSGSLWTAETQSGVSEAGAATDVDVVASDGGYYALVRIEGVSDAFEWGVSYEAQDGRVVKSVALTARDNVQLRRVFPWHVRGVAPDEVVATSLQDVAAFYRGNGHGFFASLDLPWSRISVEGDTATVGYPPFVELAAGASHQAHTLTIGGTTLSGEQRYGRDTGEVAAMDRYVQTRFAPRFNRPMNTGCSIMNRYTMPESGRVWYTYYDHPTLSRNLDLMYRDLELMPKLGMEYFQLFPGIFDWVPGDPDPDVVHSVVDFANARGVRVGDYSGCNSVFCGHYNEYSKTLDRPEWRMLTPDGVRAGFCFGCPDFVDYYADTITGAAREFGFEMHCFDFLGLHPCEDESHGHPAGVESVYHQILGLTRILERLSDVDPDMMTWSNSGNWAEFLPKISWWNHNLYLTDPFIATPWQGLNMTSLLDDARREQMVSLHYTRFMPYRFYTNCQYFFSQNSIVPDIRRYEYGALSSLAVTPNLCLAEIRPWMDRLSARDVESLEAFYQEWTKRVADNYGLWKNTWHVGDSPAPGAVEVYGHASGGHGYVFVVNANYWGVTANVPLDGQLGLDATGRCEIRELYPGNFLYLSNLGPHPEYGATLSVDVPARTVRVFEVQPARAEFDTPRVYGLPGDLVASEDGYVLRTRGQQGTSRRFAVAVAEGCAPVVSGTVDDEDPPQARRLFAETGLTLARRNGQVTWFDITFRRAPAPTDLRDWQGVAATFAEGREKQLENGFTDGMAVATPLWKEVSAAPTGYVGARALGAEPVVNFCGGYVENAFSEWQETTIHLTTSTMEQNAAGAPAAPWDSVEAPKPSDAARQPGTSWWFSTSFHLPFMYTIGAEPEFSKHVLAVFPMLDAGRVVEIKGWINGAELEIRRYGYPRNRGLATWWADLVGTAAHGGENTLVLFVTFSD